MGDHARGRGLAVGAGHCDDGDAAVFGRVFVHHVDDRFADRSALAERGRQVHAKPRCGVHFDDAATLGFQRLLHGLADDIDAGDVKADGLCGRDRAGGEFRMYLVGNVGSSAPGRQVRVVAQQDALALRWHGLRRVAFLREMGDGNVVEADLRQ